MHNWNKIVTLSIDDVLRNTGCPKKYLTHSNNKELMRRDQNNVSCKLLLKVWSFYCYILFSICPLLPSITAEKQFFIFWKTFLSIPVSIFRNVRVTRRFELDKLKHGMKSWKSCRWKNTDESSQENYIEGSKLAYPRDCLLQSMNRAFLYPTCLVLLGNNVERDHRVERYLNKNGCK